MMLQCNKIAAVLPEERLSDGGDSRPEGATGGVSPSNQICRKKQENLEKNCSLSGKLPAMKEVAQLGKTDFAGPPAPAPQSLPAGTGTLPGGA
jgi:hypothetical protein